MPQRQSPRPALQKGSVSSGALLRIEATHRTAVEGMPAVVDRYFPPDTGRITARWRWAASQGYSLTSDRGGQRAAFMYSLIVTAKMNDVDPQTWLADVLARIAEHPCAKDR